MEHFQNKHDILIRIIIIFNAVFPFLFWSCFWLSVNTYNVLLVIKASFHCKIASFYVFSFHCLVWFVSIIFAEHETFERPLREHIYCGITLRIDSSICKEFAASTIRFNNKSSIVTQSVTRLVLSGPHAIHRAFICVILEKRRKFISLWMFSARQSGTKCRHYCPARLSFTHYITNKLEIIIFCIHI